MSEWIAACGSAFSFGFLTSISPCLLATNVAAISFIARKVEHPKLVLLSGLFYTLGQSLAFIVLAAMLVSSLLSIPLVSVWLQKYMFRLLGPILVVASIFLLELVDVSVGGNRFKERVQRRAERGGFWVTALLGIVFAMSFCPTTAAWFFGFLIPLAVEFESSVFLPLCFAVGVALPVIGFAVVIALAAERIGKIFRRVGQVERVARRAAGAVFLAIGVYFTLAYTLNVL